MRGKRVFTERMKAMGPHGAVGHRGGARVSRCVLIRAWGGANVFLRRLRNVPRSLPGWFGIKARNKALRGDRVLPATERPSAGSEIGRSVRLGGRRSRGLRAGPRGSKGGGPTGTAGLQSRSRQILPPPSISQDPFGLHGGVQGLKEPPGARVQPPEMGWAACGIAKGVSFSQMGVK